MKNLSSKPINIQYKKLFRKRISRLVSAQLSNNLDIVHVELSRYMCWHFINTTAYHSGKYEASPPPIIELHKAHTFTSVYSSCPIPDPPPPAFEWHHKSHDNEWCPHQYPINGPSTSCDWIIVLMGKVIIVSVIRRRRQRQRRRRQRQRRRRWCTNRHHHEYWWSCALWCKAFFGQNVSGCKRYHRP